MPQRLGIEIEDNEKGVFLLRVQLSGKAPSAEGAKRTPRKGSLSKGRGYTMTEKIIDISGRRRAKEGEEGPKLDFAFTTGMMLKDAHELVWLLFNSGARPQKLRLPP